MAEAIKTLQPLAYHSHFLKQGIHADARSVRRFRPTVITRGLIGTADGSAMVRIGTTTVVVGIKAEVAPSATALQGDVEINVHLTPLCSSKYSIGKPPEEALAMSQFLRRSIVGSGMLDLTQLVIQTHKAVWILKADVVCIDNSGNVTDAAMLGMVAALQDVRLPEPSVQDDDISQALKLSSFVVSLTCAVLDGILIVDPIAEEEELAGCILTVVVTSTGKVCGLEKPGGAVMSPSQLRECVSLCEQRFAQVSPLLHEAAFADKK